MRTIKRDIVGAFIFSNDKKLLMGKSHEGGVYTDLWIIPGGGVEEGETKLEALRREIVEETGINIEDGMVEEIEGVLRGESEKTLRDNGERVKVQMTFYNYKVTLFKSAAEITLKTDDDFKQAKWFETDELSKIALSPPLIKTLEHLGYIKLL
jgi:8-oxo-dGTP diphosphatase